MNSNIKTRGALLAAVSLAGLSAIPAHAQDVPAAPATEASSPTNSVPGPVAEPTDQAASPSQETAEETNAGGGDEIVVTGIRAAQARAINIKKNAASVVDAISAEDIGKLPDVTIADSLQRIPGVQITRSAGEGATVNIRGLPQVVTLLNGETYIGANSIVAVQPNLSDIPSQLFAGADVIKSPTGDLLNAGITGTVNLRTRRPLDLKRGLTGAVTAEADYGDKVKHKFDPNVNGLLSWRNENFGVLLSGAYSDNRLSNSHTGIQEGYGATLHNESLADATSNGGFSPAIRPHGTAVAGGIDVNGDGDANDTFIVPQGFTAWNRITERKRLGLNGSVQWQINDALQLTGDAFFTKQTEYDRTAGIQQQDINWQAAEFVPAQSRDTGTVINGYNLNTTQIYDYDLGAFDSYAQTDRYKSQSQNYNAELKWDDGGPFKATIRGVYGKAHQYYDQSYTQFSLSNGVQWNNGIGHYPASLGGDRPFNPGGYTVGTEAQNQGVSPLPVTVDFTGNQPVFTLPGQLTSELGNISNYALKTVSSEGNYRRSADQKVIRADASYEFSDALNVEFGARYSDRGVDDFEFERVAPLYAGDASQPGGCLVKWKAADVSLNDKTCYAGTPVAGASAITFDANGNPILNAYTAGLTRKADDPSFNGQVKLFNLPGKGLPGIYVLDPHAMDNALAFQNSFYPGEVEHQNPGPSFNVGLKQVSGYFQINGQGELFGIPVQANAGLRIVNTKLDILQYIPGGPLPYGLSNTVDHTETTKRSFTDYLPAFNMAFNFTDQLKLRLAFSRTMTLLNLDQWGGGLNTFYAIDTSGPQPIFRVTGGNQTGNPQLDPWRATNVEGSFEYYLGRASLLSVGAFYINVDSFIQSGSLIRTDLPDNDGVVRNRAVSISLPIQGEGGTLKGVEAGAKLSFSDFGVPGFLSGFGIDANGTFSPSNSGQKDLAGGTIPFQDNSKYQTNVALFYEKSGLSARVAWNYRSKRAVSSDFGGIRGLELYQAPTNYIDATVSYDVTPNLTVYAQGSNLTGEYEKYYMTWTDEKAYNNIYERRFAAGVRAKF